MAAILARVSARGVCLDGVFSRKVPSIPARAPVAP